MFIKNNSELIFQAPILLLEFIKKKTRHNLQGQGCSINIQVIYQKIFQHLLQSFLYTLDNISY